MLTNRQIVVIANALWHRLGETSIAAAMLRAQQAEAQGDDLRFADWRRVAMMLARFAEPKPA